MEIVFRNEDKIKTFPDRGKQRKHVASQPRLLEMLKEVIQGGQK